MENRKNKKIRNPELQ